jgi:hypothetical protein
MYWEEKQLQEQTGGFDEIDFAFQAGAVWTITPATLPSYRIVLILILSL